MANITLTSSCNLRCPYCFADDYVESNIGYISIDNFQRALSFVKTDPQVEGVGLIGGEPLLHPHFNEIADILIKDSKISSIYLYTNGLLINKYIDILCNSKFKILINYNDVNDIGITRTRRIENNIKLLNNRGAGDRVCIGYNIYKKNVNISEIINLLKNNGFNTLRISITVPQKRIEKEDEITEYYLQYSEIVRALVLACLEENIAPYFDCNKIPSCLIDDETRKVVLAHKYKQLSNYSIFFNENKCSPVIDILADLRAIRCFGLYEETLVNIDDFDSINCLYEYYINEIDTYACKIGNFSRCNSCDKFNSDNCYGGCLCYKIEKIKNIGDKKL